MDRGWLVVSVSKPHEADQPRHVRAALLRWYRRYAEELLPRRVELWAKIRHPGTDRPPTRTAPPMGELQNHIGEIRLNWRIVQAPVSVIDYIIAHELDHVVHHDDGHGPAFWARLGRVMPDYDTRRDQLRALGPPLEW